MQTRGAAACNGGAPAPQNPDAKHPPPPPPPPPHKMNTTTPPKVINPDQMQKGFRRLAEALEDTVLDVPEAVVGFYLGGGEGFTGGRPANGRGGATGTGAA